MKRWLIVTLITFGVLVAVAIIAVVITFTVTSPTPSKLREPVSDNILPCTLSFHMIQPHEEMVAGLAPMKGGVNKLTPKSLSMELAGVALRSTHGSLLTLWGSRRPTPLALTRDTAGNIPLLQPGSQAPGFIGLSGIETHEATSLRKKTTTSETGSHGDQLTSIDLIPVWIDMTFTTQFGDRRVRVCTCDTSLAPMGLARLGDVQLYRNDTWVFLDVNRRDWVEERPATPLQLSGITNYLDDGIYTGCYAVLRTSLTACHGWTSLPTLASLQASAASEKRMDINLRVQGRVIAYASQGVSAEVDWLESFGLLAFSPYSDLEAIASGWTSSVTLTET